MATKKTLPVSQDPEQANREFRKANEVIAPRVTRGGTLSLLARKIFNVILYHTQRLGVPGANAPSDDPAYKEFYWLPLGELARDTAFNSDDTKVLKEAMLKLQDIKVVIDDAKGFASDVLIPKIRVIPDRRGKATMVGWTIDSTTEKTLLRPEFYTRLSIYYLTSLRTTAGISLYENAKRYATNPSRLTMRETWEWWHDVLTGIPMTHEKPEYKYFKRDVLKPAIDEVNTTDIRVELIEHKTGRRITHLQFRIERAAQGALELPPPPVIDTKTIDRIRELGINPREAEDIFASHDDRLVRETLDWVRDRMASTTMPRVESPAALFRSALRGRYADSKAKPARRTLPMAGEGVQAAIESKQEQSDHEAGRAMAKFEVLPPADRTRILERFAETLKGPLKKTYETLGMGSPIIRGSLAGWLARNG
ncbi:MAG: replication initiation protein [Betaproteobacteria bacterium]|nr:replication initiation protein [Betaproteobacteria bacterium]